MLLFGGEFGGGFAEEGVAWIAEDEERAVTKAGLASGSAGVSALEGAPGGSTGADAFQPNPVNARSCLSPLEPSAHRPHPAQHPSPQPALATPPRNLLPPIVAPCAQTCGPPKSLLDAAQPSLIIQP